MIKWIALVAAAGFLWGMIEANRLRVKEIKAQEVGLKQSHAPLKIVFISDIHLDYSLGFNHHRMRKVIRTIQKQNPDLVIIGGDIISKPRSYKHPVFDYFKALDIECIAVLGNHDYLDYEAVIDGYRDAGISLLVNEGIVWNGYYIYGVDDDRLGAPYITENSYDPFASILITHEPEIMRKNQNAQSFRLGLAGHHHGGHINFFGLYAPAVRSEFGQEMVKGFLKEKNLNGYITSGIGGFPLRFFAVPEIVTVTFTE